MVTFCSSAVAVYLNASSGFMNSSSPIAKAWDAARRATDPRRATKFLARTDTSWIRRPQCYSTYAGRKLANDRPRGPDWPRSDPQFGPEIAPGGSIWVKNPLWG